MPANLGVVQSACATVLHAGWHVSFGTGVAYSVILQAVEVVSAILMGMPALLNEGMSWKEIKARAMNAAPSQAGGGAVLGAGSERGEP